MKRYGRLNGALESNPSQGEFTARNKRFAWKMSSAGLPGGVNLSAVDLEVDWREGRRSVQASRSAYAKYEEK